MSSTGTQDGQARTTTTISTEFCTYCHEMEGEGDPIRCRYGRRDEGGIRRHSFDTIWMDKRLAGIVATADIRDRIRPNYWHGFDLPTEGVRFTTDEWGEHMQLLVFDGDDPAHSSLRYQVDFQPNTPMSVVFAAAAEAMAER